MFNKENLGGQSNLIVPLNTNYERSEELYTAYNISNSNSKSPGIRIVFPIVLTCVRRVQIRQSVIGHFVSPPSCPICAY